MGYPKVSIIILNWNGLSDTIECLNSLKELTYPSYEVVVVDNGSQGDDAKALKERFGCSIHLLCNDRNYGFAGGNNIGIRFAQDNLNPDYFLLLNNDTVVEPNFLDEMVKVADADPKIGVAGAKIYSYHEPDYLQFVWGEFEPWKGHAKMVPPALSSKVRKRELDKGQYDVVREVDWVSGCCFLIKKSALKEIGLLDEGYFSFWEELDFCLRARKKGYKIVFVPKAKVWHKLLKSSRRVPGLPEYYSVRNRFRLMRKYASRWQYISFLLYFFGLRFWPASLYYLFYERNPKALLGYYRGAWDGVLGSSRWAKLYL